MSGKTVLAGAAALAVVVLAAGCGGEKVSRTACKAPATSASTGLSASFPVAAELTFTAASKDGPSNLVDGYWTADLDSVYVEYQDQLKKAGYTLTHTEKDEHDAEINYKGSGRSGQVALKDDCTESSTTRVHIADRPA